MRDIRVPEDSCPCCHKPLDGALSLDLNTPSPGDLTICGGCYALLRFTKELKLAPVSMRELNEIKQVEPEVYAELTRILDVIQGGDRNG